MINADPKEIIFTSGATESNNISLKGVARFYKNKKKHIITTQTVSVFYVITQKECQKFLTIKILIVGT
jgi:cysteine sulfinate desulfinase/cysteine desulfurase-like protein